MLSTSPNLISGGLAAANNLSDLANAATARTNLGVHSKAEIAALRNALAPRGGVAFDGTASSRVYATLTNQNIGTDPFSGVLVHRVMTAAASWNGLWALSDSATAPQGRGYRFFIYRVASSSDVILSLSGATSNDYRSAQISLSAYSGKVIVLAWARSGTTLTVWVNGVQVSYTETSGGTAPTWGGSITSTYLNVGYSDTGTSNIFNGEIYATSLYNCALSAADVQEIYELGGGVPDRFKFGSQVALNTSAFTNYSATYDTFSGASASGFTAVKASGNAYAQGNPTSIAVKIGQQYRFKCTLVVNSGQAPLCELSTIGTAAYTATAQLAAGSNSVDLTVTAAGSTNVSIKTTAATDYVVSSAELVRLGAVVHLPLNDGIGYQLHDESTNKLDAVMTTTGVSHVIPQRQGYVRGTLTWSATHEAKSLIGQRALPSEAVIERITRKATAGSSGSGCTIGTTNSATRWQALDTFTTAKEAATLANTLPAGTADADNDIVVDPDTANFTGSLEVEAHYSVSEGTP